MKYLKSFNEGEMYVPYPLGDITMQEWSSSKKFKSFTEDEMEKIKTILKSPNISIDIASGTVVPKCYLKIYKTENNIRQIWLYITKYEDEWYLIINNYNVDKHEIKCDQFRGLISYLKTLEVN